jgi:hypothetical protein
MDLEEITCPCCHAKPIMVDGGDADIAPCEHLAFVFHTQADDFEYAALSFRNRLPPTVMVDWNISCYEEILKTAALLPQLLISEIQLEPYGHFGTRPTLIIGFYRHEQATTL